MLLLKGQTNLKRGIVPIFILNFNRLAPLKRLVDYLHTLPRVVPIIIDNDSTYPPLLDWYRTYPVEVRKNGHNMGTCITSVIPTADELKRRFDTEVFALTDPDLDFSGVPVDLIDVLLSGLDLYPKPVKVGVGLRIDDLPDEYPFKEKVIKFESGYWQKPVYPRRFWDAGIETTFALYRASISRTNPCFPLYPALRSDFPYVARHEPWYWTPNNLDAEKTYYLKRINAKITTWSSEALKAFNIDR